MGTPRFAPQDVPLIGWHEARETYTLYIGSTAVHFGAVSMGNPHAVIEVAALERATVEATGGALQRNAAFPESVNVGFAEIVDARPYPPARVRARRRRDPGLRQRRLRGGGGAHQAWPA